MTADDQLFHATMAAATVVTLGLVALLWIGLAAQM